MVQQKIDISPTDSHDIIGFIHRFPNYKVTCNSSEPFDNVYPCENAITPFEETHYCSKHSLPSKGWYEVSFGKLLTITGYAIQATNLSRNSAWFNPKGWKLYGIKLDDTQELIDEVTYSGLESDLIIKTFTVDKIGSYHKGAGYPLRIQQIDFFGSFFTEVKQCKTDYMRFMHSMLYTLLVLIIKK